MKSETRSFYQQAAQRIVDGLDSALDLESLAGEAALSPFHFHRVFRGMLGETPLALHRRLRVERAASALLRDDTPITTIAFDAGYETHEAFTRAFRLRYGCSPTDFRRRGVEAVASCGRPPQVELATRSGLHFSPAHSVPFDFHLLAEDLPMPVDIVEQPTLRAAAVRHIGRYSRISEAFDRLGGIAGPAGILEPDTATLAIYHDDPESTPEENLRSDAAVTIRPTVPLPAELTEIVIPAGRYARATHDGPYTGLGDAWARLMGVWLPRSGHRIRSGVSYEVHVNNPTNTKPEDLRTDLYIPIT